MHIYRIILCLTLLISFSSSKALCSNKNTLTLKLKNGTISTTTISPLTISAYPYQASTSELEQKLAEYRLVYGIGQIAHGILYHAWNIEYPNK